MSIERMIAVVLLVGLVQGCVAVAEGPTQNEKASKINVELGMGYMQQNKLELASEKLTKALDQNDKSASAHNAYAILQQRLKQDELAEFHFKRATELDPKDSSSANNYGTFLCNHGREKESEAYFLKALENPLYSTPEYAYTNAAICLLKVDEVEPARKYLRQALANKSDFAPALYSMGNLLYKDGDFESAKIYMNRYHLVARPSANSLWLSIRSSLEVDPDTDVSELVQRLKTDFPDSEQFKQWKEMQ